MSTPRVYREYYQFVIPAVIAELSESIGRAIEEDTKRLHDSYWVPKASGSPLTSANGWEIARAYLDVVEKELADLIKPHSLFYWIHLYRRLGVKLPDGLYKSKTDPATVSLVRRIAEAALAKHASLADVGDIKKSTEVALEDVLGGMLKDALIEFYKGDEKAARKMWDSQREQWLLTRYSSTDQLNLFRIEAYAYEYWRATAVMRALGKGASLAINKTGYFYDERTNDFDALIQNYDQRTARHPFAATHVGVAFEPSKKRQALDTALLLDYNIHRTPFSRMIKEAKGVPLSTISNFSIGPVNIRAYIESHKLLSESFQKEHGVRFEDICAFLGVLSSMVVSQAYSSAPADGYAGVWRLCQRSYITPNLSTAQMCDEVLGMVKEMQKAGFPTDIDLSKAAPAVSAFLTLTATKQSLVALWTYGPRFVFIPYGDRHIVDLEGIIAILVNLFFRVPHDQTARGGLFEDYVRTELAANGLNLLPERELRLADGSKRETDAAVRKGNVLFLLDCRTVEMPLDFEIGRPKTIAKRVELLDEKIDAVVSIAEFVRQNPKGRNYDYSWTKQIISIAVSPFMEWMWSRDARYWLDAGKNIPRILHPKETVEFINRFRITNPTRRAKRLRQRKNRKRHH